jgi:hypothetical protein
MATELRASGRHLVGFPGYALTLERHLRFATPKLFFNKELTPEAAIFRHSKSATFCPPRWLAAENFKNKKPRRRSPGFFLIETGKSFYIGTNSTASAMT